MKTHKIKKVLIALDYDPTAQKIAEEGFSLAKAINAEVVLLHVISDVLYYSSVEYSPIMGFNGYMEMGQLQIGNVAGLKQAAQKFLDKSKKHLGDPGIRTLLKEGDFADTIIKTAKDLHADIIVVGSHSRKWLENIVMGSVTQEVMHLTQIPLYIIPTKKYK